MASGLAQPLRRLHRKLTLAVWLGRFVRQGSVVLAVAGCAILVARAGFGVETERALWLLLPVGAVPFTAWAGVRAKIPSEAGAVAWLDLRSGASGHLLAGFEQGDERWNGPVESQLSKLPELPAIRLGSFARVMVPAMAFAALALLMPLSRAEPGPSTGFFDSAIAGLASQLKTLAEVTGLDQNIEKELTERVTELAKNVDATKPEAMLEAIDSLRGDLAREGQGAADVAQDLFERFGHSENQSGLHSMFAQKLFESGLKSMMKDGLSAELMQQVAKLAPQLASKLDGNELKLPEGFKLSPEALQGLSALMRDQLRSNLGELDLAGLINLKDLALSSTPKSLSDLINKFHKHDESCKQPGGT
jgi:hypothetical protein